MYAKAINTLQWILAIQQIEKGEQTCQRIIEETCVELQKKWFILRDIDVK